jgi:hypothetical protein
MIRRAGQGQGPGLLSAVAIAAVLSFANDARAEESSFHCPTDRTIRLGDPLFEAKGLCGEPTQVDQRMEKEKVGLKARRISSPSQDFIEERMITLEVEEWYYDLGTKHRARLLRFENGRLASITIGKRGARPRADAGPSVSNDAPDGGAK